MDYLKLAKQIRELLNSAHQEFSNQIKKDKNISNNYIKISYLYQAIVKRLSNKRMQKIYSSNYKLIISTVGKLFFPLF